MPWTTEFALFLAIGLAILIFEAHRQFNEPSYTRPTGEKPDDAEVIYVLSPSEIRSRSAFFSAELVYIGVIVAFYLLFIFNDSFHRVVGYVIQFVSAGTQTGGGAPPEPAGAAAGAAATAVDASPATRDPTTIEGAAVPFVVSVTMVTALRFPFVRRIEVMLRSFAHRLFGIPAIPVRLRQKIEETPVDLAAIEAELPASLRDGHYGERIAGYVAAAEAMQVPRLHLDDFRRNLQKLAAYQIWVRDLKIWPSAEFKSDFVLYHTMNDPLLTDVSALMKDLDLMSNQAAAEAAAPAAATGETADQRGMRRELMDLKIQQGARLAKRVCAVMALYDQNSSWPDASKPGAASLRSFLAKARSDDEARTFQINLAIILIILSAAVNAVAGYVHAGWLERIAIDLGLAQPGGPYNIQFDPARTARDFAVSALIIYGLSIWVALEYRRRAMRSGTWRNFFNWPGAVPPMTRLLPLMLVVGLTVLAVHFVFAYGQSVGWNFAGERNEAWWSNFARQRNLSLMFALVGAIHGTAVAILMDLERRQYETWVWLAVILAYVVVLAGLGYFVGQYLSSGSFNVTPSRPEVRHMREILYTFDLALIALLTSFALTSFTRPSTVPLMPVPGLKRKPAT